MIPKTGRIAVATAGTAVAGPDVMFSHRLILSGLPGNTGLVAFGNVAGDITVATGFTLDKGDQIVIDGSGNLSDFVFDAVTNGDIVQYMCY